MGDFYTNAVRHPEDIGVGHIRRTIKFGMTAPSANGIPVCGLEAGAIPLYAHVTVTEGFNAGTTNSLILGTIADDDGFATAAGTIAGTPGFKGNLTGALTGQPLAANTVVYAKYAQTGTAATAGAAIVVLEFINKREIETREFPNNP